VADLAQRVGEVVPQLVGDHVTVQVRTFGRLDDEVALADRGRDVDQFAQQRHAVPPKPPQNLVTLTIDRNFRNRTIAPDPVN
jgi:hypothetical protein